MIRRTEIAPADEAAIVDHICTMIDTVQERLTTEASREALERGLYELLCRGDDKVLSLATVIDWAHAGSVPASRALRRWSYERWQAGQDLPADVLAYAMADFVAPLIPKYPRGRGGTIDTWTRDIGIACLVELTVRGTGLPATRSRGTTQPSAAYLVTKAFQRRGHRLKEQAVNRICYARSALAERLTASMPGQPFNKIFLG